MFDDIGWQEILLVLMILLIVFGAGKLPDIGKGLGKSIREFRKAVNGESEDKKETEANTAIVSQENKTK